jgi:hypothetical protein
LNKQAAVATLFIGAIKGLIILPLLAEDVERMRRETPRRFCSLLSWNRG